MRSLYHKFPFKNYFDMRSLYYKLPIECNPDDRVHHFLMHFVEHIDYFNGFLLKRNPIPPVLLTSRQNNGTLFYDYIRM